MVSIENCPVCDNQRFKPFNQCIDFSVSHETFDLSICEKCSFVLTTPRPDDSLLPKYYESSNYISHSKEAKSIFDKLYRVIRGFALTWKIDLIKEYSDQSNMFLLDYGAGTGSFLQECKRQGWSIAGVEPSTPARSIANSQLSDAIKENITEINHRFEVITLWHVLEHVPNLSETFNQLSTRLNNKGTMFIAVPNHKSADAIHYGKYWAGYDVPRHLWHFNKSVMEKLASKHGFKIVKTVPMKLDAYYVSMLSEGYLANTRNLATFTRGLVAGFKSNFQARTNSEYSSLIYILKKDA